ncbi:hypothetical protein [Streptomyces xanthophaeus]
MDQSPTETTTHDIQQIPAQIQMQESPTIVVARERLIEAIGREAVFLADQRAGQASTGLETLARAFTLVTSPAGTVTATPASSGLRNLDIAQQDYSAYNEATPKSLGFKDVENLGGGLKTVYQLEAGFQNDTGGTAL